MKILKTKLLLAFFISGFFLFGLTGVSEAATYFVKPAGDGGSDSNTGLSDAQAWATVNKANSYNFQTGDNVFFKCGGTWKYGTPQWSSEPSLKIDWSGTADNRVVIGAYYGNGVIGVSENRPIIDGDHKAPGPLPCEAGCYAGIISISNQDYIDVENIIIKNSEGYGLKFNPSNNCNAYNVKTNNTYRSGIYFKDSNIGGGSSIVEGCEVADFSVVWPEYCSKQIPRCTWPGGLVGISTKNITIRKNIVHEGHGEGIYFGNLWDSNGGNALIEDNIVYDIRAISIYTHNIGDIVIRRNLVYGTGNPKYCNRYINDGVYFAGQGIYVCDEDWPSGYNMDNIKIYDNLVAFTAAGIHIGNSRNSFSNSAVYNNIFVDNYNSISITGKFASNSFIKNNIFWCISDDCTIYNGPSSISGIEFSNNLWSSNPPDGIKGPNDIYDLPQLLKTTGWRSMTAGSLNGSDFTLQSISPAINAGTNLGAPYNQGLNSASTWVNNISTLNQNDYGNWEIGAFVYADVPIPASTCQTEGYQCCNSCQLGPHSEYNGNCPGQVCCEVCTPGAIIPPSCSDSGTCCATGWICDGGPGENLPGCDNVCCIGGTCVSAPAASVCQNEGYKCCASCKLEPQPEYDESCASGVCCAICTPAAIPPLGEVGVKNPTKTADFAQIVENTIIWALSIIGSLALLMFIIGGIMYMGSTGDEQKALTAKKIVTYAVFGIVLVLLSYSIAVVLSGILS